MRPLFGFLGSSAGRALRAGVGLVLILVGLLTLETPASWGVAMLGFFPLFAGMFDFCVFAPLCGLPFEGSHLRQALKENE
jgi:hypothetical protein